MEDETYIYAELSDKILLFLQILILYFCCLSSVLRSDHHLHVRELRMGIPSGPVDATFIIYHTIGIQAIEITENIVREYNVNLKILSVCGTRTPSYLSKQSLNHQPDNQS